MKKLICVILSILLVLLAGCGKQPQDDNICRVAIVQTLDHTSLNEIRTAITQRLTALADEKGIEIEIREYNGQNDTTVLNQIGAEVAENGTDLVIPIATLAATCMVTALEDSGTPVVYAAISDPESALLTGLPTVTGTSDALNTAFILDMILAAVPETKTVGLLYSNSEINSRTAISQAKEALDGRGIAWVEKTGNTADEILTAATTLAGKVDAVFTPTDNVVMASAGAVGEIFLQAGVPFYAGADSFVQEGAFATCGVNYTNLGAKTAEMAFDILMGGAVPEYHVMDGGIIMVNDQTAAALGIDYGCFRDMTGTLTVVGQ